MQEGKWITLRDGRHILLKPKEFKMNDTNFYMNNMLRSSNQKEFTKKDIKVAKRLGPEYKNRVDAYELNGWYLVKDYGESLKNNSWFNWAISKKDSVPWNYIEKRKAQEKGEFFYVDNYKDGIDKLIKKANE